MRHKTAYYTSLNNDKLEHEKGLLAHHTPIYYNGKHRSCQEPVRIFHKTSTIILSLLGWRGQICRWGEGHRRTYSVIPLADFACVPSGWWALRGTFKQRRSRLLAPRLGDGVRLRGAVWLHRSPLHPVCRFAQDDTVRSRCVERKTKCRIS